MRLLKQFFNFYLNSSIHVAFAAVALSWISLIEFEIDYDKNMLSFIFFATITGYNFVKYFGIAKFHHRRLTSGLKIIQLFSFICFAFMCYFASQLAGRTLFFIAVFACVTFLYAIPFIPQGFYLHKHQQLREVSGLKVYVIALVWAGVTVLLPLINNEFSCNADVYITLLQRFIFVVVLMLPFEIRDLKFDGLKLATIPQKTGVKHTKYIGVLLLFVFFFTEFLKDEVSHAGLFKTLVIALITLVFLLFSSKERSLYYSAFYVEGIPMLWLLIVMLG